MSKHYPYLHREKTRHGRINFYVRCSKGPRVRIEGIKGTEAFRRAYRDAVATAARGVTSPALPVPAAPPAAHRKPCSVYIVSIDGKEIPSKIGIAFDPPSRLRRLASGNPNRLSVVQVYETPSRDAAARIERLVLRSLRASSMFGEWLAVSPSTISSLIRRFADEAGINLKSVAVQRIGNKDLPHPVPTIPAPS